MENGKTYSYFPYLVAIGFILFHFFLWKIKVFRSTMYHTFTEACIFNVCKDVYMSNKYIFEITGFGVTALIITLVIYSTIWLLFLYSREWYKTWAQ